MKCPCNPNSQFSMCCEPIILGDNAATAEQLMRSRFSAFATYNDDYINKTFSSVNNLEHSDNKSNREQQWLGLTICSSTHDKVEFKAYYVFETNLYVLHEVSDFVIEHGKWRYDKGIVVEHDTIKFPRNTECFCGSGKKYKRCCLNK